MARRTSARIAAAVLRLRKETVAHFSGRVASWELWNEPYNNCRFPGSSADFQRLVFGPGFDAIRAAEPNAIVLGPSVTTATQLSNFYKDNSGYLVRPVNAINIHHYGSVADIEGSMDTTNGFHPCTTSGYCVQKYELTEYGFDEGTDSSNAVQVTKHCEAQANCERLYYFIQWGQGDNALGDPYGSYALLDNNNVPRAKYWALRDYMTSHEVPLPPNLYPGTLSWSAHGPIAGQYCTQINELDPHSWNDNYLCSTVDAGLRWSAGGPIAGMACTLMNEPADPDYWNDNYLCAPVDYGFTWTYAGLNAGLAAMHCVQIVEPTEPGYWYDNYLCYY